MRRMQAVLEATGGGEVLFERDARDSVLHLPLHARASSRRLRNSPPSPLLRDSASMLAIAQSKLHCLHVPVCER